MAEQKNSIYFARTNFRGEERICGIKLSDRRQHMYLVGKTGTGKTNLIKNMIIQDILAGRGVCVVDPHGELVEELLEKIPENRTDDIIYFNPADTDYPIGFNVLEVSDKKYKHLVAQGLIGIFTKIWANVWSARMEYILQNCILALIETPGTTLLGIQRILTDKEYRQNILKNVTDPVVKAFWVNEYEAWRDQFRNEAIVPIQNKVGQFVSTSLIRNIVGQPKSSFDVYDVMNEGKILLVNISKGRIGEENSALLGAMLITKIQLAAMERVRLPEEERRDFYLYVDEFQNFATEAFASILSEARKYRLDLILAHQYIGQLVTDTTTKVRDSIFGNVGTMIIFRVGAADAEFLEKEFTPEFSVQDLVCLPNYNIYLKLMVNGMTSRPFSAVTIPPLATTAEMTTREHVVDVSRSRYARSVMEVEEGIRTWSSAVQGVSPEGTGTIMGRGRGTERFETPCWICKKTAYTIFKPDGRRPIYCSECLKKTEAGELRPLRPLPGVKREREEMGGGLEELGIEFDAPKRTEAKERTFAEAPRRPPAGVPKPKRFSSSGVPPIKQGEIAAKRVESQRPLSLKELKTRIKKDTNKDDRLSQLRQILKESLEEKESDEGSEKKNTSKIIKPGESIRFE